MTDTLKFKVGDKVLHWRGATREIVAIRQDKHGWQYEAQLVDNPNGCHHAQLLVENTGDFEDRYRKVEVLTHDAVVGRLTRTQLESIVSDVLYVGWRNKYGGTLTHTLSTGEVRTPPRWVSLEPALKMMGEKIVH